jgi:phenylpyruvate tautomerase PptA (4-oxalocrotonate tautomerase family)
MPTYTVKYSNFNLSQKQKNLLANDISNTHSKFTGANTFFAQVIFQKNEKNSHFMGGKLVKTKEIFLNGQIRAGRTLTVKKKINFRAKKNFN